MQFPYLSRLVAFNMNERWKSVWRPSPALLHQLPHRPPLPVLVPLAPVVVKATTRERPLQGGYEFRSPLEEQDLDPVFLRDAYTNDAEAYTWTSGSRRDGRGWVGSKVRRGSRVRRPSCLHSQNRLFKLVYPVNLREKRDLFGLY